MALEDAIKLLRNAVKWAGTIEQKHIDLTIIPAHERSKYEEALKIAQTSVKNGEITRDELMGKLHLI